MDTRIQAVVYELLALSFTCPTIEFAETLVSGEYKDALLEIAPLAGVDHSATAALAQAVNAYAGRDAHQVRSELRVEHTRLFVGAPIPLISYSEGVWRCRKRGDAECFLMVNSFTLDTESFMKSCGVFTSNDNHDPIDNIYSEFEFAQFLLTADTLPDSRGDRPHEAYRRFFDEHLASWVLGFCDDVIAETDSAFYKGLAQFCAEFIELQIEKDYASKLSLMGGE